MFNKLKDLLGSLRGDFNRWNASPSEKAEMAAREADEREQTQLRAQHSREFNPSPLRLTTNMYRDRQNPSDLRVTRSMFPRAYDNQEGFMMGTRPYQEDEALVPGPQGYAPIRSDVASMRQPNIRPVTSFRMPNRINEVDLSDTRNRLRF